MLLYNGSELHTVGADPSHLCAYLAARLRVQGSSLLGELLLLRLVVECLVEDAQARLAVYAAHSVASSSSKAAKHDLESLLTQSELYRVIATVSRVSFTLQPLDAAVSSS